VISSRRIRVVLLVVLIAVGITVTGCVSWILRSPLYLSSVGNSDLLVVDTIFSFGIVDGFAIYRFATLDLERHQHKFIGYGLLPKQKYHGYPFSSGGSRIFLAGFGGRVFELSRVDRKISVEQLFRRPGLSEFCVSGDNVIWREGSSVPFYHVSDISDGSTEVFRPGGMRLFLVGCGEEHALFDTRLADGSRVLQEVSFKDDHPPVSVVESSEERFVLGDVDWLSGEMVYRRGDTRFFLSQQGAEQVEVPANRNIFIGNDHLYFCLGADPCAIEVRDKPTLESVGEYSIPGACVFLFELPDQVSNRA